MGERNWRWEGLTETDWLMWHWRGHWQMWHWRWHWRDWRDDWSDLIYKVKERERDEGTLYLVNISSLLPSLYCWAWPINGSSYALCGPWLQRNGSFLAFLWCYCERRTYFAVSRLLGHSSRKLDCSLQLSLAILHNKEPGYSEKPCILYIGTWRSILI